MCRKPEKLKNAIFREFLSIFRYFSGTPPKFHRHVCIDRVREGDNNQKLILFILGKAISGAPNISGTNQFSNAPIIIKKIITKA